MRKILFLIIINTECDLWQTSVPVATNLIKLSFLDERVEHRLEICKNDENIFIRTNVKVELDSTVLSLKLNFALGKPVLSWQKYYKIMPGKVLMRPYSLYR